MEYEANHGEKNNQIDPKIVNQSGKDLIFEALGYLKLSC